MSEDSSQETWIVNTTKNTADRLSYLKFAIKNSYKNKCEKIRRAKERERRRRYFEMRRREVLKRRSVRLEGDIKNKLIPSGRPEMKRDTTTSAATLNKDRNNNNNENPAAEPNPKMMKLELRMTMRMSNFSTFKVVSNPENEENRATGGRKNEKLNSWNWLLDNWNYENLIMLSNFLYVNEIKKICVCNFESSMK